MNTKKETVKEEINCSENENDKELNAENSETSDNVEEEVESETAKLSRESSEWQDKYLRLSAEFDNFRKRTLKEKMNLIESAGEDVIKNILPVIDDLDRAMIASESAEDIETVTAGIGLISKKLKDTLAKKGLVEIDAINQLFDTDLHEAIANFPVEEAEKKNHVIEVLEKGYKLNEKVVRFSKVIVGE